MIIRGCADDGALGAQPPRLFTVDLGYWFPGEGLDGGADIIQHQGCYLQYRVAGIGLGLRRKPSGRKVANDVVIDLPPASLVAWRFEIDEEYVRGIVGPEKDLEKLFRCPIGVHNAMCSPCAGSLGYLSWWKGR